MAAKRLVLPHHFAWATFTPPCGNVNLPRGNVDLPAGNVNLLGGNVDLPGGNVNLLGGNVNLPRGNVNLSRGTVDLRGGNVDLPGGNVNLRGGNVNLPGGNVNLLGGNVNLPGGIFILPWGRLTLPQGRFILLEDGPVAILTVLRNGPPTMGKHLVQWFLFCFLVSYTAAYIARHTLTFGAPGMDVMRITATVALVAYGYGYFQDSIWKGIPWSNSLRGFLDAVFYAVATGLVFRFLWPAV